MAVKIEVPPVDDDEDVVDEDATDATDEGPAGDATDEGPAGDGVADGAPASDPDAPTDPASIPRLDVPRVGADLSDDATAAGRRGTVREAPSPRRPAVRPSAPPARAQTLERTPDPDGKQRLRALARLSADVPAEVLAAVNTEAARLERDGTGDRQTLARGMVALLARSPDTIDTTLDLVDAARPWVERDRTRRLEYGVDPALVTLVEKQQEWALRLRGIELSKTEIVIAMTVAVVDPDAEVEELAADDQARLDALLGPG